MAFLKLWIEHPTYNQWLTYCWIFRIMVESFNGDGIYQMFIETMYVPACQISWTEHRKNIHPRNVDDSFELCGTGPVVFPFDEPSPDTIGWIILRCMSSEGLSILNDQCVQVLHACLLTNIIYEQLIETTQLLFSVDWFSCGFAVGSVQYDPSRRDNSNSSRYLPNVWMNNSKVRQIVNDSKYVSHCPKGMCVCAALNPYCFMVRCSCAAVYIMNEHRGVTLWSNRCGIIIAV